MKSEHSSPFSLSLLYCNQSKSILGRIVPFNAFFFTVVCHAQWNWRVTFFPCLPSCLLQLKGTPFFVCLFYSWFLLDFCLDAQVLVQHSRKWGLVLISNNTSHNQDSHPKQSEYNISCILLDCMSSYPAKVTNSRKINDWEDLGMRTKQGIRVKGEAETEGREMWAPGDQ